MELFTVDRYLVLVCGIYIMSVSGSIYMYSAYDTILQTDLQWNDNAQTQLVGTMSNVGVWVGFLGGFFYAHFGPRLTSLMSAIMVFLGYMGIYLSTQRITPTHYLFVGFCGLILGQGSWWGYTVAVHSSVVNFDIKDRGKIIGLLTSFFSLCSGIYAEILRGYFPGDLSRFMLLAAIGFPCVIVFFGMFASGSKSDEPTDAWRLIYNNVLTVILALFLAFTSLFKTFYSSAPSELYFTIPIYVIFALFLLSAVILPSGPLIKCGEAREPDAFAKNFTSLPKKVKEQEESRRDVRLSRPKEQFPTSSDAEQKEQELVKRKLQARDTVTAQKKEEASSDTEQSGKATTDEGERKQAEKITPAVEDEDSDDDSSSSSDSSDDEAGTNQDTVILVPQSSSTSASGSSTPISTSLNKDSTNNQNNNHSRINSSNTDTHSRTNSNNNTNTNNNGYKSRMKRKKRAHRPDRPKQYRRTVLFQIQNKQKNLWQCMKTVDYWLLVFIMSGSVGAGIITVNNISKLVISRETFVTLPTESNPQRIESLPHNKDIGTFVVLFSVCNTLGRIITGFFSDVFLRSKPRTLFLLAIVIIMGAAQIIMAFATIPVMYLGIVIIGLSYGGFFCLIPTLASEIYGLSHFGANFGFILSASAAGSIFLSEAMASPIADYFKKSKSVCLTVVNGTCTTQCYGTVCYEYTYFGLTGVCLVCFVAALFLHKRQKKDIESKTRDAASSLAELPTVAISTTL